MVAGREEGGCDGGSAALPSGAGEGTWYHLRKQPCIGNAHAKESLASISRFRGFFLQWENAHVGWLGDVFPAGF